MDDAVLSPLMFLHGLFSVEFLCTNVTLERSVIPMSSLMNPQISFLCVLFAAHLAGEWLLAGVGHQVPLHRGHAHKVLQAYGTLGLQLFVLFSRARFISFKHIGQARTILDKAISNIIVRNHDAVLHLAVCHHCVHQRLFLCDSAVCIHVLVAGSRLFVRSRRDVGKIGCQVRGGHHYVRVRKVLGWGRCSCGGAVRSVSWGTV